MFVPIHLYLVKFHCILILVVHATMHASARERTIGGERPTDAKQQRLRATDILGPPPPIVLAAQKIF